MWHNYMSMSSQYTGQNVRRVKLNDGGYILMEVSEKWFENMVRKLEMKESLN